MAEDQAKKKAKIEAKATTVQSKRRGGEGVMLKKTYVKFDDSDDEYQDDPELKQDEDGT